MKTMNKFFALTLALVLLLGMAVSVSAATGNSITINGKSTGHIYEAYQIFKGDVSINAAGDKVLSNIQWGDGITDEGKTTLGDAAAKAATIKTAENAKAFANELEQYLTNPQGFTANGTEYTLTDLAAGYYLVKDQKDSQNKEDGAYTAFIMQIVGEVEVDSKDSVPTANKSVQDKNDSVHNNLDTWGNSADYEIGDDVPFKVEATLASNVAAYEGPYMLVFHDTMGAGLTYNGDITIKVDDVLVYSAKPVEGFTNKGGISVSYNAEKLVITIDDAKQLGAENSSVIVMEYTAELNAQANLYITGNTNKIKLQYANDPNWKDPNPDDDETPTPPTGETPESVVVVFTYSLAVDKVELNPDYDVTKDEDGDGVDSEENQKYKALPGAGFTLYKKYATGENQFEWKQVGEELKGEALTEFVWNGLDDGDYKLVETTVPTGYNKAEDVVFTITATHGLEGAEHSLALSGDGFVLKEDGVLNAEIENKPGVVLPGTGGMGTTIFYILGGVMVVAAVVLLVTKKRMSAAE